jgi:hypothetical protein
MTLTKTIFASIIFLFVSNSIFVNIVQIADWRMSLVFLIFSIVIGMAMLIAFSIKYAIGLRNNAINFLIISFGLGGMILSYLTNSLGVSVDDTYFFEIILIGIFIITIVYGWFTYVTRKY